MYLICDAAVQSYEQQAPQYDPSKSSLYVLIYSLTGGAPCAIPADGGLAKPDLSGWSVAVEAADGGALGAPIAYLDTSYNPQSATTTFSTGAAIAYDVDPSLGFVTVQATKAGVQDATHDQCPLLLPQGDFTGLVAVGAGQFGFFPYVVQ